MFEFANMYTLSVFFLMVLFLVWRPRGINESLPPAVSAILIFLAGIVPLSDIYEIFGIVSGAAITILSTIVMSIVLSSIGLFRWAAYNLVSRANGSGIHLYWYILLLCFLMTLFFNNDGSILITTPIIIEIVRILKLKPHEQFPYLISGALIATAASAPIAVSNLANLISLRIVGLDLNGYVSMMFVPSMIGIILMALLLFYYFYKDIPIQIPQVSLSTMEVQSGVLSNGEKPPDHFQDAWEDNNHQKHYKHKKTLPHQKKHSHLKIQHNSPPLPKPHLTKPHLGGVSSVVSLIQSVFSRGKESVSVIDKSMFKVCIGIVILIRAGLFVGAGFNIPIEWVSILGAVLLVGYRWWKKKTVPTDLLRQTPWHIMLFAFSIYVVVYALHNIGLTEKLVTYLRGPMSMSTLSAGLIFGGLVTVMSNVFNNLPSVMIGTFALTSMGLDTATMQIAYLANIIGSDLGSLLTPMGTLATLIWMYLLRTNGIPMSWKDYMRVTIMVIPIATIVSLLSLYFWTEWLFF